VDVHADVLSGAEGGTEDVEVYSVHLTSWRAGAAVATAFLQRCDLRPKARAAPAGAAAAAGGLGGGGALALRPGAAGAVGLGGDGLLNHWTQRLYKSSRLYRNANVLRSYQVGLGVQVRLL
jgi:hypothetical protein